MPDNARSRAARTDPEIARLQQALHDERERRSAAERRAELLEESARRAFRLVAWGGGVRRDKEAE